MQGVLFAVFGLVAEPRYRYRPSGQVGKVGKVGNRKTAVSLIKLGTMSRFICPFWGHIKPKLWHS
jgi:hypothetical protein